MSPRLMQGLRKRNQILEFVVAQLAATGFGFVGQFLARALAEAIRLMGIESSPGSLIIRRDLDCTYFS